MISTFWIAFVTIVAAAGINVDSGLPGVTPGSRNSVYHEETIWELKLAITLATLKQQLARSRWATRAWTIKRAWCAQYMSSLVRGRYIASSNKQHYVKLSKSRGMSSQTWTCCHHLAVHLVIPSRETVISREFTLDWLAPILITIEHTKQIRWTHSLVSWTSLGYLLVSNSPRVSQRTISQNICCGHALKRSSDQAKTVQ